MAMKYQTMLQKTKEGLGTVDRELTRRVVPAYWKKVEEKDPYTHSWQHENTVVSYKKEGNQWVVSTKTGDDVKTVGTHEKKSDAHHHAIEIMREML